MRKIKRYFEGRETSDGAGVKLRRCFGYYQIPEFDPFLLMDFFDSDNPDDYTQGFPWHPHRGIETITYLISGEIEHEDSLGNKGTIRDGECQWMSAASGILHQEMPKASPHMLGTQIWLNMPNKNKMDVPEYRDITEENVGRYEEDDLEIKIIGGVYREIKGPIVKEETEPRVLDVKLGRNREWQDEIEAGHNVILFLMRGSLEFPGEASREAPLGVLYERDGRGIKLKSGDDGARFLLLSGKPLKEEIAWGGPIVMGNKWDLELAFKELEDGNFIKNR